MKTIEEEFHYDRPADDVFSLISSGSFQLELIAHLGGSDATIEEESGAGDGAVRVVTRQRTGVELPGFAKKLIPANTTVVQTYDWLAPAEGGVRSGTWSAEIKGAPVSMSGPTVLRPEADGGCLHVYGGEIRASVPLIGGKLESFALENLRRELRRSHEFISSRLGD